ncbi:MAG: Stk1 family PASTA domain-containing Ser/Thr kinase [Clostridiales bacterium]|nr:Stk1 family PASTA domain-containing Ser/Thr kinase [Clostridiales bacterium]
MKTENLVGTTLGGRYEVLENIGTGGMATVFKAKDSLLNRFVAIKVLRDNLEGEEQVVTNFIKEAQSSASLVHNNIVSVYDVGEENGINYMVMELVDGITLKKYIRENGALPWQEACDYAIQIGQGINEAHANNIIHRDIKPQNIIMTQDKTLKVTDFGIARAAAADTTIVGGTALGSVHYISPEQARGGFTDARSDIYSLGIVLYEMLTGKVPFDGDTPVSVALMHLEKEPVDVKCVNMDIPTDLAYVTMKAIAKEQKNRYQNVQEMLNDLHAVLAEEPLPSKEVISDGGMLDDETDDFGYDGDEEIIDDEPIRENTKSRSKKRKKARKKKTAAQKKEDRLAVILAIGTVAALLLIVFGAYKFINNMKGTSVPNLVNMTVEEATQKLLEIDLKAADEIEYSLSDDIEEGRVVTQDPAANTFLAKGSAVKLIVSIGPSGGNIQAPQTVGKTFEEAIEDILALGLTYTVKEEPSDSVEANRVIRQLPIAGTMLNQNDIITLHISMGKGNSTTEAPAMVQKVKVPDVVGLGREQAEEILAKYGLSISSVTRSPSSVGENLIISQSPDSSKTVVKGSSVSIVLSSGNEQSTQSSSAQEGQHNFYGQEVDENGATAAPEPEENRSEQPEEEPPREEPQPEKQTKTFTMKIPDSAGDTVEVEIVADGVTVHSGTHQKSEGYVSAQISGEGTVTVQAYVDGALAAQKQITF